MAASCWSCTRAAAARQCRSAGQPGSWAHKPGTTIDGQAGLYSLCNTSIAVHYRRGRVRRRGSEVKDIAAVGVARHLPH